MVEWSGLWTQPRESKRHKEKQKAETTTHTTSMNITEILFQYFVNSNIKIHAALLANRTTIENIIRVLLLYIISTAHNIFNWIFFNCDYVCVSL